MSVINQVLKDLDKRQQSAHGARVRSHYQPASGRPWLWVGALTGAVVLSIALTWWLVAHALTPDDRSNEVLGPDMDNSRNVKADSTPLAVASLPLNAVQPAASNESAPVTTSVPTPVAVTEQAEPADSTPVLSTQTTSNASLGGSESTQVAIAQHQTTNSGTDMTAADDNSLQPQEVQESRGDMQVERVQRSASELAAQRLDQAIGAMESGEGRKAEALLQEALVLAPQFVDARQQLAAYYYGRGFTSEALRVLREGLAHAPAETRLLMLSARIYEESGRADEALTMLNRVDANLPQQSDIVVLRAAMANELGQYQIAADDYRELLAINPNQGIWWLGLAVAEEGRADYDAARLAYQRAIEDTELDRASRAFARTREEALTAW